jgi:hypothetical protein
MKTVLKTMLPITTFCTPVYPGSVFGVRAE